MQGGASNGGFEVRCNDFDARGCFNRVEIDPSLTGIPHFSHALWALETLDVRRERAVLTGQHDGVAYAQFAPVEDDVDGLAHTDLVAHFEHGALSGAQRVGETVLKEALSQAHGHGKEVLETLTLFGRHGHERYVLSKVSNFIVAFEVESMLGKLPDRLPIAILKQRSNILSLSAERFDKRAPSLAAPAVKAVDFVAGDHERRSCLLEDVERLDRLRLQAFHDVDNQDGDVSHRTAAISQRSEGMVAWSVDEQQAG